MRVGLFAQATKWPKGAIYQSEIEFFKEWTAIGDRMTCHEPDFDGIQKHGYLSTESTCIIKQKYPHVALTTRGCFTWVELLIWNRHLVRRGRFFD